MNKSNILQWEKALLNFDVGLVCIIIFNEGFEFNYFFCQF